MIMNFDNVKEPSRPAFTGAWLRPAEDFKH